MKTYTEFLNEQSAIQAADFRQWLAANRDKPQKDLEAAIRKNYPGISPSQVRAEIEIYNDVSREFKEKIARQKMALVKYLQQKNYIKDRGKWALYRAHFEAAGYPNRQVVINLGQQIGCAVTVEQRPSRYSSKYAVYHIAVKNTMTIDGVQVTPGLDLVWVNTAEPQS